MLCATAFAVPESGKSICVLRHLFISYIACTFPILVPICRVSLDLETSVQGIPFAEYIGPFRHAAYHCDWNLDVLQQIIHCFGKQG